MTTSNVSGFIPIKSSKGEKHQVVWVDSFSFSKFYFSIIVFFSLQMEVAGDLHDLPPGPLAWAKEGISTKRTERQTWMPLAQNMMWLSPACNPVRQSRFPSGWISFDSRSLSLTSRKEWSHNSQGALWFIKRSSCSQSLRAKANYPVTHRLLNATLHLFLEQKRHPRAFWRDSPQESLPAVPPRLRTPPDCWIPGLSFLGLSLNCDPQVTICNVILASSCWRLLSSSSED